MRAKNIGMLPIYSTSDINNPIKNAAKNTVQKTGMKNLKKRVALVETCVIVLTINYEQFNYEFFCEFDNIRSIIKSTKVTRKGNSRLRIPFSIGLNYI